MTDAEQSECINASVRECISLWPQSAQTAFGTIRDIVFEVADRAKIGVLEETLKWGQPSWLPQRPRTGSTLRCNWSATQPERISLYVHCNSSLVDTVKELYPESFEYEGRRGMHLSLAKPLPSEAIDHCALLTLTYHRKHA